MLQGMQELAKWYAESNEPEVLFACISGSHAYGMANEDSDLDIRGIWVEDTDRFLALNPPHPKNATIMYNNNGSDVVLHELGKFVNLALKNNPSILDVLFSPEHLIIVDSPTYRELREVGPMLLTRKGVFDAYCGYAQQQLKRALGIKKQKFTVPVFSDQQYKEKMLELYRQYPDVKWESVLPQHVSVTKTEESDVINYKNAAHLLRLLSSGEHTLRTGEFCVVPPNKKFIMQVRYGRVSTEEILDEEKRLRSAIKEAYNASPLNDDNNDAVKWANDFITRQRKERMT